MTFSILDTHESGDLVDTTPTPERDARRYAEQLARAYRIRPRFEYLDGGVCRVSLPEKRLAPIRFAPLV